MASYPNRFFKGWCSNEGNKRSKIIHYIISSVRDISDYSGGRIPEEIESLEEYFDVDGLSLGEPYYAIYGTFKLDVARGPIKIFETDELRVAIFIVEHLTGNRVKENEIHY